MRLKPNPDARTPLEKQVRRGLLGLADVQEGDAVFGDCDRNTAYFVDATQMANFVGENALALRLTRKKISEMRAALKADPRVEFRRSGGDWIGLHFASRQDADFAVQLAGVAAELHRPTGRPAQPPPTGADLARRERFH